MPNSHTSIKRVKGQQSLVPKGFTPDSIKLRVRLWKTWIPGICIHSHRCLIKLMSTLALFIFWFVVLQKKTNSAQRWRILFCQSSGLNRVFVNWPTSESLAEDVIFKPKYKRWEGTSYANLQGKWYYGSGLKSKLLQRLILERWLSISPYLS